MTKKLYKALTEQNKKSKPQQILGLLGLPLGGKRYVEVPRRNSFVYVRLRDNQSEVIQAFNNKVSPSYNLPVIVQREGNRYTVVSVDTQRYGSNWNDYSSYLPRHGNTHSMSFETGGGGDIVWVHSRQFTPMLSMPSGTDGGPNVIISPYVLQNDQDGSWMYIGGTGTPSLLPYLPTGSNAVMALVFVDAQSGNPGIIVGSGSYFPNTLTGTSQVLPYIPQTTNPNWIPDSAIRLVTGTSSIGWNNIYDMRQFLHVRTTGSGGGAQGIVGIVAQDEGVLLGTGTVFNFTGEGVTASRSGTVIRVDVPFGGEYAIISSGYTGTVIPSGSTSNVKFYQELSDPSSLVSISANSNSIVFNDAGWYSVNLVLQYVIGTGAALTSDGSFIITGDNNGSFDNAYRDVFVKTGEAHNGHNEFMNYSVYMTAGQTVGVILQNNTEGSITAYIQEIRIEKK